MIDYVVRDFQEVSDLDSVFESILETGDARREICLLGCDENRFSLDVGEAGVVVGFPGKETSFPKIEVAESFSRILLRCAEPSNFNTVMREIDVWFSLIKRLRDMEGNIGNGKE